MHVWRNACRKRRWWTISWALLDRVVSAFLSAANEARVNESHASPWCTRLHLHLLLEVDKRGVVVAGDLVIVFGLEIDHRHGCVIDLTVKFLKVQHLLPPKQHVRRTVGPCPSCPPDTMDVRLWRNRWIVADDGFDLPKVHPAGHGVGAHHHIELAIVEPSDDAPTLLRREGRRELFARHAVVKIEQRRQPLRRFPRRHKHQNPAQFLHQQKVQHHKRLVLRSAHNHVLGEGRRDREVARRCNDVAVHGCCGPFVADSGSSHGLPGTVAIEPTVGDVEGREDQPQRGQLLWVVAERCREQQLPDPPRCTVLARTHERRGPPHCVPRGERPHCKRRFDRRVCSVRRREKRGEPLGVRLAEQSVGLVHHEKLDVLHCDGGRCANVIHQSTRGGDHHIHLALPPLKRPGRSEDPLLFCKRHLAAQRRDAERLDGGAASVCRDDRGVQIKDPLDLSDEVPVRQHHHRSDSSNNALRKALHDREDVRQRLATAGRGRHANVPGVHRAAVAQEQPRDHCLLHREEL
eukprot:m.17559 g.17559  ORF g.17559 m.17559 type:complete len:520 (+) comp9358_c0_seq1:3069-4628(+)